MKTGTNLANEIEVPVPTSTTIANQQVTERRNQHIAAFGKRDSFGVRVSGLVILGIALAVLGHGGLPVWRIVVIATVMAAIHFLHFWILRTPLKPSDIDLRFVVMTFSGQFAMVLFATLTGGLRSPLVPALTMSIVMSMIFIGPRGPTAYLTGIFGVLCAIMAVLPASVTGPILPTSHLVVATMLGLGWTLIGIHMVVAMLHNASTAALGTLEVAREERVVDAENQTRRLKMVGSRVAHELKNPLTSIKGLIQLVARTPESDRTQERLAVVQTEVMRMQTIIEEYLTFARPLEDLRVEGVDLAVLAANVGAAVAGRIEQGGLNLVLDVRPTLLRGDPRRLVDALGNLVANAIEATPRGGTIRIRARPIPGIAGMRAGGRLEVEDTGRGIDAQDLEKIGTSYFTTRPGGTGLGVVLVQGVIGQHGGELMYESAVGRGTIAKIELPGEPPDASNSGALRHCQSAEFDGHDPVTAPSPVETGVATATGARPPCVAAVLRRRILERRS